MKKSQSRFFLKGSFYGIYVGRFSRDVVYRTDYGF